MSAHDLHEPVSKSRAERRKHKAANCPITKLKKRQLAQSKLDYQAAEKAEKEKADKEKAKAAKIKADLKKPIETVDDKKPSKKPSKK